MADLIDRGRLIEDLENAKVSLGDIFFSAVLDSAIKCVKNQPSVDAVPVVYGYWKEYTHSALVNWKNGEPVWADRAVYRCSKCYFGTIIKHNYCPRCGAKMGR